MIWQIASLMKTGERSNRDQRDMRIDRLKKKNEGFTLVEMVITVAIFSVLLGILVPSLDSVLGFRASRAANSIMSALDKTRREAMSRLVGEMKLEYSSDGYYITYYLDRGKAGADSANIQESDREKIAPAGTKISYTDSTGRTYHLWEQEKRSILLTYDRATGGFLPIQSKAWTQNEILKVLGEGQDIPLEREESLPYCESITVQGGLRTIVILLDKETGKYTRM